MRGYRDPLKAGVFSGLVPGAGQVYAGEPTRGVTFFMGTATGLFLFVVPGVLIWAAAVVDAVAGARRRNRDAAPLELPVEVSPVLTPATVHVTDGPPPGERRRPIVEPHPERVIR